MTAKVTYDHPDLGSTTEVIDGYRTLPNGTLACRLPDGGQLLLPPQGWILRDDDTE